MGSGCHGTGYPAKQAMGWEPRNGGSARGAVDAGSFREWEGLVGLGPGGHGGRHAQQGHAGGGTGMLPVPGLLCPSHLGPARLSYACCVLPSHVETLLALSTLPAAGCPPTPTTWLRQGRRPLWRTMLCAEPPASSAWQP